ncbi:hypothetical protein FRC16_007179 [Serendipita sp. 398]|nr:hypothetical protein FRC16_007179 [Serendipita sp. 398]
MNQARALGQHWLSTPINAVYCSDLKRAHMTAQQLVAPRNVRAEGVNVTSESGGNNNDTRLLTPIVNPLLREQNFGIAEGKPWAAAPSSADETEEEIYYSIYTRHEKFPEGESLDDLAERADKALDETVWPHVQQALASGEHRDIHIVVVSHGLTISELVAALLRRSPILPSSVKSYRGLHNTGWTQLAIDIDHPAPPHETEWEVSNIRVVSVNNSPHLVSVKRQGSGIGSAAYDEKQKTLREFFGGGGATSTTKDKGNSTTSGST